MNTNRFHLKAVLDWRKLIFILPLVALWVMPFSRAINLISYAKDVYASEQTINASNDVSYGVALLFTYLLCLLMEVVLCLLLVRKNVFVLLLLLSMPIWIAIQIIRFQPEEVVVLVPSLNILWPLKWNFIAFVVGLALLGLHKLKAHKLGNARTN